MDYFFDMALALVFATIKNFVKNPQRKEEVKRALVKLGHAIAAAYPDEFDNGK